jgi:zinc-ribbon domain
VRDRKHDKQEVLRSVWQLLTSRCTTCGAKNAPSSAFCEDCGTALAGNVASAAVSSPQAASTAPNIRITPELLRASTTIDGERTAIGTSHLLPLKARYSGRSSRGRNIVGNGLKQRRAPRCHRLFKPVAR